MTRRLLSALPTLIILGLLSGCGGDANSDKRTATGEVLSGTISDDMLPLDTVKSQAPLADPGAHKAANAAAAAEGDATVADAPVEGAAPPAAPAPAEGGEVPKPGFGN